MEKTSNTTSRKKFFLWSLGVLSSISAFTSFFGGRPGKMRENTLKMLSEDGKLVEVDMDKITKTGIKVSDKDVITWVKNKPTF